VLEPDEKEQEQCHKDMFVEDMIIAYRCEEFPQKLGNIFVNLKSYGPQLLIFY
jgi:hypothetical protein